MAFISELEKKQVINVTSGRVLGKIKEVYIDESGKAEAFTVEKKKSLFSKSGKTEQFTVRWEDIVEYGSDVILVKTETATVVRKSEAAANWQGYFAAALIILSLIILIKSITG